MLDELRKLTAEDRATPAQRAELTRALTELHWRKLRREQAPAVTRILDQESGQQSVDHDKCALLEPVFNLSSR